jgi:hypothetical protein
MSSDSAKRRENPGLARLEWQGELDSHLAVLDSRLAPPPPRPRRTAFPPPDRDDTRERGLKPGKTLIIRYRLPWPFSLLPRRRRREHPLTTARLRA